MTFETKLVAAGVYGTAAKALAGGDMAVALTAAGTTQATAAPIVNDISVFGTVAASSGAILPSYGSAYCTVFNGGANALAVYPPVGGAINAGAANAAFSVGAGKSATFMSPDGVTWVANLSA